MISTCNVYGTAKSNNNCNEFDLHDLYQNFSFHDSCLYDESQVFLKTVFGFNESQESSLGRQAPTCKFLALTKIFSIWFF